MLGRVHVALSLRDRKAELSNNIGEAFGSPVAERQGDMGRSPIDVSPPSFGEPGGVSPGPDGARRSPGADAARLTKTIAENRVEQSQPAQQKTAPSGCSMRSLVSE